MDIQSTIDYYSNLLIIQYNNQPKARATISALAKELLANGIIFDIRDAFNLDTAVGVQLDIIGKYVGVDRFYKVLDLVNFFAFTDYTEVDPDAQQKFGFSTYATFDDDHHNGTLTYNSFLSTTNRLNDDDYRVIIRLKILQNNINHSHKSIDDGIFSIFGLAVRPSSNGNMQMTYFISSNVSEIIQAAIYKKLLPRPMGVGLTMITDVTAPFFGYATYSQIQSGMISQNIVGFSDYSDYATKQGHFLTYNVTEQV